MKPDEITEFHQAWLQHPVTRQLNKILENHEHNIVSSLAERSTQFGGISDQEFRILGVQLKTIQTIKKLINDTPTFASKVSA